MDIRTKIRMCIVTWIVVVATLSPLLFGSRAAEPNNGSSTPATPKGTMARYVPDQATLRRGYGRTPQRGRFTATGVYKARIAPRWFHDNSRFWYRNDLKGGAREFILVDAERGTREPAFDHVKLAEGLSKASGSTYSAKQLPFDSIEFGPNDKAVEFTIGNARWKCELTTYACAPMDAKSEAKPLRKETIQPSDESRELSPEESPWIDDPEARAEQQLAKPARQRGRNADRSSRSPDGKWTAFVKDQNLFIRSQAGEETQLSRDGREGLSYGLPSWAPDSKFLVAFRIELGDRKEVYLIESSPRGGGRAKLSSRPYALPGDKFTSYDMHLFDVVNHAEIKCSVDKIDFGLPALRWRPNSHVFTYEKTDRGHQRFRLIEVDAQTGSARNIIDEKTETFIWTAHRDRMNFNLVNWLKDGDEIIYVSERDGWRHLYLVDAKRGEIKNQITTGDFVVRAIDRIDEAKRQIWFQASGRNPEQDPYFIHFYRVNFDGTNLVALTEGNGNHTIQYSPDSKYMIDTYSRVDMPPVHELRRVSDGSRVCNLDKSEISELQATRWEAPEVFVAKGRDGTTDIWGIINRPRGLDPRKKYPVVESIYAGPQGSFVPKAFSAANRYAALTALGFIVVQIDGMGTANRSKAFHDVCWKNLKDAGFPDRILWHKAVAKKYPYYDISRVGIYGTSAGGQNAAGAALFHPEFYKAAVAACGCHDNRMDKASWNEQWMGYPVGPQYAESSNITHAGNLRGKLLLIVGEMDTNVPPESTYRLVDALIKARKDFEFLAVPGMGHSNGGAYGIRRMQDFFVRHLHGVEPPDWNTGAPG